MSRSFIVFISSRAIDREAKMAEGVLRNDQRTSICRAGQSLKSNSNVCLGRKRRRRDKFDSMRGIGPLNSHCSKFQ